MASERWWRRGTITAVSRRRRRPGRPAPRPDSCASRSSHLSSVQCSTRWVRSVRWPGGAAVAGVRHNGAVPDVPAAVDEESRPGCPPGRPVPDLPGLGGRGGQDLRHAGRGLAPPPAGRRRGHRLRRDPRPPAHGRADPRPRGRAPQGGRVPGRRLRGDGHSRPCWPGAPRWCWSTSWPTPTCPGSGPHEKRWEDVLELLEAGHRRGEHRQHPAPREPGRRGGGDHRGADPRAGPRLGGAQGRPARAHRLLGRPAAPAHAARQHLPGRQGARRPDRVLQDREPGGPARAGAALRGRRDRRGAPRATWRPSSPGRSGTPPSGSWWRSPGPRGATGWCAGPPAWPSG